MKILNSIIVTSYAMGKRKKSLFDDGSDDGRKRKKFDLSEQLQELYDSLRNYKTSSGKLLCETFIRAPKRRSLADYYEVVSSPIDLLRIQQKIRMDEYDDLDQFNKDIELLVSNTKSYYKNDSVEYADANKLWDVYIELRDDLFGSSAKTIESGDEDSNEESNESNGGHADSISESDAEDSQYEELFSAVMTATSEDGRQLSTIFELLPSPQRYPDYFVVVTEPIDLKMIATKIQQNEYNNLNDLEKDFMLMIRNAKTYNAPGSQIYRDANSLRKVVLSKKNEIEIRRNQPLKSSQRIRAKRQNPHGPKWSAITAMLKYEEDENNCDGGEESDNNGETMNFSDSEDTHSNPYWLLFNAVKDTPHSEPFIKLPSKRHYPDYYKEIKHPISLAQIGNKIKNNCYENISDLEDDIILVFDNAMCYNRPDSKIFKDAAKLRKILQLKSREIINVFNNDEVEDQNQSKVVARSAGSRATRKSSKSMVNAMSKELKNVRRSQKQGDSQLKKRLRLLYKTMLDYTDSEDRFLIDPFMEKPPKKVYPDYYEIIENPIDMKTIDQNIKNDIYQTEEALIADFHLMFNNCRKYNEDNSQIHQDACTLEAVLNHKFRELGTISTVTEKPKKDRNRPSSAIQLKIKNLYEAIRDFTDSKGRLLSIIFQKLPSRTEFPDYYEVIRKPICLEKIGSRVKNGIYETPEDLLSDIILMLDNACKYNEPDSQIFKDALTLQQVALQTKIDLNQDSFNGIPDVKIIVQDLLTNLFISVYNHQDEEGRCFSDSINELSEQIPDKSCETELKTLNFDIIKRNLNQGRYRRLDRFQQDMFEVCERARKMSRTDSQAFEDSIDLQLYFIAQRNELCSNGGILESDALKYTHTQVIQSAHALRREKVPKEISEEDMRTEDSNNISSLSIGSSTIENVTAGSSADAMILDKAETMVVYQDVVYKIGDFVYVTPNDKNLEPHIIYIEKFRRDPSNDQTLIHGCWFYRPSETYHIPSRRFLEKEVFKTDSYTSTPLSHVMGKCCVMFVKDYFRSKPLDFAEQDVYVCESRYSCKGKSFKKIKAWTFDLNVPIILRDVPLEINRVPSVFKDQVASSSIGFMDKSLNDELLEQDLLTNIEEETIPKVLDVPRPNVICAAPEGIQIEGATFYEQFTIPAGTFRVGDCCYVRTDQERNLICRIDRMWVDADGNPFFHGPWFVQQAELPPNTVGSFYPQEVFLSSIEDTNPLLSICERCCVLDVHDYTLHRPTEFYEKDVYVCDIRYLEHEKKFESLSLQGLRKFKYQNPGVVKDEIYIFPRKLFLQKDSYVLPQVIEDLPQPTMVPGTNAQWNIDGQAMIGSRPSIDIEMNDESNMSSLSMSLNMSSNSVTMPTHSIDSIGTPLSTPNAVATRHTASTSAPPPIKKPKQPKRLVTGYIIFASEVRKSVVEANPDYSFGDISRLIGAQWKILSQEQKADYEHRAAKQNAETKEQAAAETAMMEQMGYRLHLPKPKVEPGTVVVNGVYECHWEHKCDYQFEDVNDLFEHLTGEPNGHVWISYADAKNKEPGEYQCMFYGCGRVRKSAPPFPSISRLIRHCKEVHINKAVPKVVDPENRSRNYVPSSKRQHESTLQLDQSNAQIQLQPGSSLNAQGFQTIQLTSGHPNTIQTIVTTQNGQPGTAFIPQSLMGTTTIGGQTIQIQQPTAGSSVSQQVHFAHVQQQQQQQSHQTSSIQIKPQQTSQGVQVKPVEPLFMNPPRTNRLVHTHTYMKYIESLKPGKRFISNWEKQLCATAPESNGSQSQTTQVDPRLSGWLDNGGSAPENGGSNNESVVKWLWSLRDFMMKDALNLSNL